MSGDREKPKGPPRSHMEALIRRSDGEDVDEDLIKRLGRQHLLCRAALEYPLAVLKSRIVPTMFGDSDYGDFWTAACNLKLEAKPLEMADVLAEMTRKQDKMFVGVGDQKLWTDVFQQSRVVSLDYAIEILVPEVVSAHDLKRFSVTTTSLNSKIGQVEPVPLFQRYLTETLEISRTPDGAQVNAALGTTIDAWDPSLLAGKIIPSGIDAIDVTSGGGPGKGDLVVVGGGTNHGKSYLAEHLLHMSAGIGLKVLYLSVEDPEELMKCRLIARHTSPSIAPKWIRKPPEPHEAPSSGYSLPAIDAAKKKVDPGGHMYIDQKRKGRISDVCDMLRRYRFQHGIVAACVDYLQAIQVDDPAKGTPNLVQETARKVGLLKECADALGIALYLTSQYARDEYKDGQEPSINACKYAGDIENEAEVMVLLWRASSGELMAKIPKAKWVESKDPRYFIRRQQGTGCFLRWEHDFTGGQQGQGQGQQGGNQRGQSQRPGGFGRRGAGRQL